jgi:flagellin-like hook-associated protein FlgL
MASVGTLTTAKGLVMSESGTPQSRAEDQHAARGAGLIQQVVDAGNTTFMGRNLFGGSFNTAPPFTFDSTGVVYSGDQQISTHSSTPVLSTTTTSTATRPSPP